MSLSTLYRCILDDVIKNVKPEFDAEGLEDTVLHDLQSVRAPRPCSLARSLPRSPWSRYSVVSPASTLRAKIWEERLQTATTVFNQETYYGHQQQAQQPPPPQQYDASGSYASYSADGQHQYQNLQGNDLYYVRPLHRPSEKSRCGLTRATAEPAVRTTRPLRPSPHGDQHLVHQLHTHITALRL